MSVKDWASTNRWLLVKRSGEWFLDSPRNGGPLKASWHPTFSEAHAAYLDAVTCEAMPPLDGWGRCERARGHTAAHHHPHQTSTAAPALWVNPK